MEVRPDAREGSPARTVVAYAKALRQRNQENGGDDAKDGADGVEFKYVALANRAGDGPADQSAADTEQHSHEDTDALASWNQQAGEYANDDSDQDEAEVSAPAGRLGAQPLSS